MVASAIPIAIPTRTDPNCSRHESRADLRNGVLDLVQHRGEGAAAHLQLQRRELDALLQRVVRMARVAMALRLGLPLPVPPRRVVITGTESRGSFL